ncbi:MAG: helicase-related protein, partial [Candidatus Falkowbacteria bacterium]
HKKIEEDSQIIIGTHALIQENIEFNNLGLAIIDEQHRFGVEQRKKLISAGTPHLLSMTATPIPRSLALAMYGDLDLSIIDEMPKNRKKILTYIVPEKKRADGYKFIREEIKKGRQVFVICPLIDISDKLGVKSVKEEFEKLDKKVFHDLEIGFLHGKMPARGGSASGGKHSKESIMQNFLENKIKILVSTSVVEVGVDVPNATVMIIEGAERFGLAQLHQFRGRVGRGEHQSYCFLFSGSNSEKTKNRLDALTKNHNGLELAKIDLKQRGPGQVYGKEQKGFPELKVASLNDYKLMKQAQDQAIKLIKENGNLEKWPILKEKIDNYNKKIHLE